MTNNNVKVRFAPSPTGELHLGGARTALFNWLFAKASKGSFFLRIEDTDKERSKQLYTDQIIDALKWLGLDWEDPIIYQSGRADRYKQYLNTLLQNNLCYRCFCSKEDLERSKKEDYFQYDGTCRGLSDEEIKAKLNQGISFTLRIKVDQGKTIFEDLVYGKNITDHKELDDFIIARSDGSPTYNFTVVVDDYEMEISHVIRGDDHLSNTSKQLIIYKALDLKPPQFAHLPMILGPDKKRLSKRHGAPGIQNFKEKGYLPESLLNYLALLGWNPKNEEEVFTLDELSNKFSFNQVQKKGAAWDEQKLHWISGQHMIIKSSEFILDSVRFIDLEWGKGSDISTLVRIIDILKPRCKSLDEIILLSKPFFSEPTVFEESEVRKAWSDENTTKHLSDYCNEIASAPIWNAENIEKITKNFASENSLSLGKIIMPLRLALLGSLNGPAVYDIIEILGKKEVFKRIDSAIKNFIGK